MVQYHEQNLDQNDGTAYLHLCYDRAQSLRCFRTELLSCSYCVSCECRVQRFVALPESQRRTV